MMKPSRLLLQTTLVSSIAAIYGPAASAQTPPAPSPAASAAAGSSGSKVESLDTVNVTGYRASLLRAMNIKRNSDSIVDVISAEDIGKFPDTNAAESLAHLPGVAVDRLYGEGEKVSINGTDPALNRVLVNGQTIASGDWGGNPSDNSGRTFNYTLLSPEIIGVMEVYKSPEARIDEGSIGGTVIINTRKPLDLPANTLRGSLGYSYNDRSRDGNPRASVLYSWKNEANDFGVLAAVSHDKQTLSQAGIEFFGYTTGSGISPSATISGSGNPQTARMPVAIDSDFFQQTRQRDSFQGAVQWKPNDKNELNLTGIYVHGKYNNYSEARYACPGCGDVDKITKATVNNGLITAATVTAGAGNGNQPYAELDANYRESTVTTKSLNLRHDFKVDDWKLTSQVGYTSASGGKSPEYLMKYLLKSGGYSFSYGPKQAGIVYDNGSASNWGLDAAPAGSAPGASIDGKYQAGGIYYAESSDDERYGQMDVTKQLNWGPINEVLVGAKFLRHTNGVSARGNRINTTSAITLDQFGSSFAPSTLYDGLDVSGDVKNWSTADLGAVKSYLLGQPQGAFNTDYGSSFNVRETTSNLYTQFNYDIGGVRGNFGVRYVNTKDDSNYYLSSDGGSTYSPTTTDTSYRKLLPSFNAAYDLDSTKVLRFSVAKVLARPRYADLAGATNLDLLKATGSGGNPNLKPYESTNFDLAGEWYFAPQSMVGAEFFYRDVSNYVVNVTNDRVINNRTFSISSPVNASSAKVKGLSLMYQQELGYGFGLQSNYTYAKADTGEGLNLPYLSKNTLNVIPYFEYGGFTGRVVYSWRSQYFTQIGRLNSQDFTDQYKQLDLSASYQITKNIGVNLSATNLLDQTYYQFSGTKDAPTGFYKNGRTIVLGMSFKL
jgi:iron complex outermembrane receptor protein